MARTKGIANFAVNFEPGGQTPLDARTLVATKADLTAAGSFGANIYNGMIVSVVEDGTLWMLMNMSAPTDIASWKQMNATDSSAEVEELKDQVDELSGNITTISGDVTTIKNEIGVSGDSPTGIYKEIADEVSRATAAEKANADAIVAEKERAEGIEAKLRTDVDYCGQRIDEDLENTSKALEYKVQWDESKSKIVLPSGGQLVGTKYGADGSNPADGAVIAQLNEWDVMDFGSTKFALNLNVPSGVRPTVQEAGQSGAEANKIAYLSDIEELKTIIATLTQRIEALESK